MTNEYSPDAASLVASALAHWRTRCEAAERELANAVAALTEVRALHGPTPDGYCQTCGRWVPYPCQTWTALGPWAFTAGQERLAGAVEPVPGPDDTAELGRRGDQLRKDQP